MEENKEEKKEVEQTNSNVEVGADVEKVSKDYDDAEKDVDENSEGFANKRIGQTLEKYKEKVDKLLEEKKFEYFIKEKNLDVKDVKDLTPEQKEEYEKFELSQETKDTICGDLYEEAKKEVKDINDARHAKLKEIGSSIDSLKEETEKLIESKSEELKKLDPEKNAEEIAKLNEEISRLKDVHGKIVGTKNKDGKETGLLADYKGALATQEQVRENTYNGLVETFGENLPAKDEKYIKGIKEDKNKEVENGNVEGKDDKKEEQKEEQVEEKGGTIPPEVAAQIAKQMAGQPVVEAVAKDDIPEEEPKVDYAELLGYGNNGLNYNSSKELLQVFLGEKAGPTGVVLDDKTRIDLLSTPEAAQMVQNALLTMNDKSDKLNFLKKHFPFIGHNAINKKVMNMLQKQLPEYFKEMEGQVGDNDKKIILDELGELDPNKDIEEQLEEISGDKLKDLNTKVDSLSKSYANEMADLRRKLANKDLSDEERKAYKEELNNVMQKDKMFNNVVAKRLKVYQFSKVADEATKGEIKVDSMLKAADKIKEPSKSVDEELNELGKSFSDELSKNNNTPEVAEQSAAERKENQPIVEEQQKNNQGPQI